MENEPFGNAQLFRLARRELFLKQEWTLPSSTVSKKVKQNRQAEYISVSVTRMPRKTVAPEAAREKEVPESWTIPLVASQRMPPKCSLRT